MKYKNDSSISLIEKMEMERIKEEKRKRKEEANKAPKPDLLKRILSGIIDIFIVFILAVLIQMFIQFVVFNWVGYDDLVTDTQNMFKSSGLYQIDENGNYVEFEENDNIDNIIINYYSTDSYALENNKLNDYNKAKEDSNYFTLDSNNNFIVKDNVSQEALTTFYYSEYKNAINYFDSNPEYIKLLDKMSKTIILSIIFSISLASTLIYLIIPLLRKEGETLSQIMFKICIVDARDLSKIKKWQIIVRFLVILLFDYLMPIVLFIQNGMFIPLPIIVTVGMMCVMKNNISPHDYVSQSLVVLKRRTDAFETLKAITNQK